MAKAKKFTAAELITRIRNRWSGNAYAVLEQVANGTGAGVDSWIDAAVFSLWPSNGLWRAACEVKVSRADFLKELSRPTKNEWAREHFDYFWYVVAPGVAKDNEVPASCGLLTTHGDGLKVVKQAPRRENVKTDASIIASFARSIDKERRRFETRGIHEAVQNNHHFKEAVIWKEGANLYLRKCGEYCHPATAEALCQKLEEVAKAKLPETVEADHMLRVLEGFSSNVSRFLLAIAPLAATALNARDETAEFIIATYGGQDSKSLESLRKILQLKSKDDSSRWVRDMAKAEAGVRDALAETEVASV